MKAKCLAILGVMVFCAAIASAATEPSWSHPLQGKVGYSFMSDYMWRGINATKVFGGHTGQGAQEATYGVGIDLKDLSPDYSGLFWLTVQQAYFNSMANQTNEHLAKTDIDLAYTIACPCLNGDWTIDYRNYRWNNLRFVNGVRLNNVNERSQEIGLQFAYNDGDLFKAITGEDFGKRVLNPTIKYIWDYDLADNGGLLIGGISHAFQLEDIAPDLTGLSLTPSAQLVMDNRYYGPYFENLTAGQLGVREQTNVAYAEYGLNLGADLSKMMSWTTAKLQANVGMAYVNAYEDFLKDQLYSYFNITYKW